MKYVYPKEPRRLRLETTIECNCGKKFTNVTEKAIFVFSDHSFKQLFYDIAAWVHIKLKRHEIKEKYDIL